MGPQWGHGRLPVRRKSAPWFAPLSGDHAGIDNRAGRGRARHCIDGARWRAGKRRHARADAAAARTAKPRTTRHERRQSRAGQWSHALCREAYCSSTPERVAAAPWPLSRTTSGDGVGMDAAVGRRHERANSEGRTSPDACFLGEQERRARRSSRPPRVSRRRVLPRDSERAVLVALAIAEAMAA